MKHNQTIEEALEKFTHEFEKVKTTHPEEQRKVLARYAVAIQPNFTQWLATTASSVRSNRARKIISQNLYDEISQDHPGMLNRFCGAASVTLSPEDVENSTKDLYYINGDVFDRGYATSVRKVAALSVMENASALFIPTLENYARNLGSTDFEYTQVHGVADIEHAQELVEALNHEIEEQQKYGHVQGFCKSATKIGAHHSAEFLVNILSPSRKEYISII